MFKSLTDKARALSGGIADKAKDCVSGNFSAGTSKTSEFLESVEPPAIVVAQV